MGTQLPLPNRDRAPHFRPRSIVAKRLHGSRCRLLWSIGLGPGHIVLDGDSAPLPQKGAQSPIFGPYLLCPNGSMDQDATWYGGRPRLRRHCLMGTQLPLPNRAEPPIFGPCPLSPNGCMDQDASWYGERLRQATLC